MLTLNQVERENSRYNEFKQHWELVYLDEDGEYKNICDLDLKLTSITKKFNLIQEFVEDMCSVVPEFSYWFKDLIESYAQSGYNSELILEAAPDMVRYSKEYIENKCIDQKGEEVKLTEYYKKFTNNFKKSKTSIVFDHNDIVAIMIAACAFKMYSIICYDERMEPPKNIHRKIYETLLSPCIEIGTTNKIFELLRARTFKSSITDRYMWDFIKMSINVTPETHIMGRYNFFLENMIPLLSIYRNPVHYIVSVIDDSIKWIFRDAYKDRISYGEFFGTSEDLHGVSSSKDSFFIYCCNDVISKVADSGLSALELNLCFKQPKKKTYLENFNLVEVINIEDALDDKMTPEGVFEDAVDRIENITYIIPTMKLVTLPIASKVLEIPYKYYMSASPKHAMLTGVFLYYVASDLFEEEYPFINDFLLAAPENKNYLTTKTTYKIRNLEQLFNNKSEIFNFNDFSFKFDVMSNLTGILSASKKNVVSVLDGKKLNKISYLDLESDVIAFFSKFYSGKLDRTFDEIRSRVDKVLV